MSTTEEETHDNLCPPATKAIAGDTIFKKNKH